MSKSKYQSKIDPSILKALEKDHNKKAVYAKISAKSYKKLKRELMDREMELREWIEEKISEI